MRWHLLIPYARAVVVVYVRRRRRAFARLRLAAASSTAVTDSSVCADERRKEEEVLMQPARLVLADGVQLVRDSITTTDKSEASGLDAGRDGGKARGTKSKAGSKHLRM